MKQIAFLAFIFSTVTIGFCQEIKDTVVLKEDRTAIQELRAFDTDFDKKYTDGTFNYERNDGEAKNAIAQFIDWVFKGLQRAFGITISPVLANVLEYVVYLLLGLLALYLLVKFLIGEHFNALFTKKATPIMDVILSETHIENLDLDTLIADAVTQQNYRLAIRYQYLKTLKLLSQKELIAWHFEKTNTDYENEITQTALKPLFKEVSYLYDYIWYGEQEIDETKYQTAQLRFVALKNNLPH
ncbi:hypothetical protein U1E44_02585 [Arenibacter sp. GZD96]|uniref:hypothetical protein n=1 Tax=Aurantibrevibacter litoralis TaxID=3106030 RepID=UPI002AFDDEFF|nr:hypothetical protein [Arenibacter sp. GZD-96]MEA1784966.1 hypothetical protein [Arenibacter sp. GZD-96]